MALFLSAGFVGFSFRCVVGKDNSRAPAIEDFEGFENRTKHFNYLTMILVGLPLAIMSQRLNRPKLAPGIPMVGAVIFSMSRRIAKGSVMSRVSVSFVFSPSAETTQDELLDLVD